MEVSHETRPATGVILIANIRFVNLASIDEALNTLITARNWLAGLKNGAKKELKVIR